MNINEPNSKITAPFVSCSDIHLHREDDERGQLLLDVIGRIDPEKVKVFLLNGDIFDFCLGSGAYFADKFKTIGERLTKLSKSGVRVIFVEGNHEFHMTDLKWEGVEVVTALEKDISWEGGPKIVATHGDLVQDIFTYKIYRGFLKSRFVKFMVSLIPGKWLDTYALGHAKVSRAQDIYRSIDHGKLLSELRKWLGARQADHMVFGHFHVPYAEPLAPNSPRLMMSVDCWDEPNLLVYEYEGFWRIPLTKPGEPFQLQRAEPLFSK